jgi:glutamate racemase
MDSAAPIGVFDSGIGGLTVFKEIAAVLPHESMIYIADSGFAPYGTRTKQYITTRSRLLTRYLLDQGCKLIVLACNTATGASISTLRKEFPVPFIGVEPAIKPAVLASKSGHVGVLATEQTFKGEHFKRTSERFNGSAQVHVQAGNGLVELIESGRSESEEARTLLERYLTPMIRAGVDQLVLGCTHYPFLIPLINKMIPSGVTVIDPAPAVARQTRKVLESSGGINEGKGQPEYTFFTTGDPVQLEAMVQQVAGKYSVKPLP